MTPTSYELKKLLKIRQRIERLQVQFMRELSGVNGSKNGKVRKRRKMSAAGRKAIAKGQRKRWAAYRHTHQH